MRSAASFFLISASIATIACASGKPAKASWRRDYIIGADAGRCLNGKRVVNVQADCPEFQKGRKRGKKKQKRAPGGLFFNNDGGGHK